jgi:hypothetical protein
LRNMKVDKNQFDALLHRMMQATPEPKKAIKTEGIKGSKAPIIPPPSERDKA